MKSASCHAAWGVESHVPHTSIRFPDDSGRKLIDVLADAPSGAVIELAPGRFEGPLHITRPVTLKGAGDLSRIVGTDIASVVTIDVPEPELVFLESLSIEGGRALDGGGVSVRRGRVRLFNVLVQACEARRSGGGLFVGGGEVQARLLRLNGLSSDRGGAVAVEADGRLTLHDGQCHDTQAGVGGAVHASGDARVVLSSVTFGRTRALRPSGGQVAWVGDSGTEGVRLELERVRFEAAPMGQPLVVDGESPGRVVLFECDVPSDVLTNPGVVDGGRNHWR